MSPVQISQPINPVPLPQNKLGQYTLLEKIAQGGMAQVFKAKTVDPNGIERLVVIKRILPHIAAQNEYIEMLIDEAKIAVHFTHGNIAQVYDLGRIGDDYFIVMEYVDGHTLSQIFKLLNEQQRKIPIDVLLYCFIELCHALSYIHRKTGPTGRPLGVVHRDVSPQNIILSYGGNIKIIDFGVAKAGFLQDKTEHGVLKGKFAYMSPEQTKGGKIDYRSDIFSAGILLWEMVTGERLFKRQSHQDTIRAVQKTKFVLASTKRNDCPKELDKVIKKALSRHPRQRYQDAADMARDLEKILFAVHPDFRPIKAAQFLHEVFGPMSDEAHLPVPFFVKGLPTVKPNETHEFTEKSKKIPTGLLEERTHHDPIQMETTPIVKIPQARSLRFLHGLLLVLILLIFVVGSFSVYRHNQLDRHAFLGFAGVQAGMVLLLNQNEYVLDEGIPIEVQSRTDYQIRIKRLGYDDFTQTVWLDPRELRHIPIVMQKSIPPFGDVEATTTPPGARVFVNGIEGPERTPTILRNLKAGETYQLRFSLPHYVDTQREVTIVGGDVLSIQVALAIHYATLHLKSDPVGAMVSLNGTLLGVTPYSFEHLVPGENIEIKLSLPGFQDEVMLMTMNAGDVKETTLHLKPLVDPTGQMPSENLPPLSTAH